MAGGGRAFRAIRAKKSCPPAEGLSSAFMRALVRTQGTQVWVEEGKILQLNRFVGAEIGDSIELNEVLLLGEGAETKVGTPLLAGAMVTAKLLSQERGKKVLVMKRLRRKGAHKKRGHRQALSTIQIVAVEDGTNGA
ncbi:MAG: 50S ribosomal protein L21 [Puniceicoccales bacterium]|jgi:large subunit ribosomal protein L21|nr:50S ribosomal protein L21 [Puniceicoccales bacterium]